MGLLVCKVGTTAAGTGGETIFVPSTQQAILGVNAQYAPGIGTNADATAGLADFPMNNRAGATACATTLSLMFGTDKGMMNMLQIATGDVNVIAGIM